jgi:dethiobiotin synthetase
MNKQAVCTKSSELRDRKKFFITGTGTDVGKSIITAAIAELILQNNLSPAIIKPVQTGLEEYPSDLQTITSLVNDILPLPDSIAMPYAFNFPASPHLAADLENSSINPEKIINAVKLSENYPWDILLLEGAGGVMVPLNNTYMMIDLIADLDIPLILVASLELGAINHTLLTLETIKKYNINLAGVIFNMMPNENNIIAKDNIHIIQKFSDCEVLGVVHNAISTSSKVLDFNKIKNEFSDMSKLKQVLFNL